MGLEYSRRRDWVLSSVVLVMKMEVQGRTGGTGIVIPSHRKRNGMPQRLWVICCSSESIESEEDSFQLYYRYSTGDSRRNLEIRVSLEASPWNCDKQQW